MILLGLVFKFIIIIQVTNVVKFSLADFENYIAFSCNRPTLVFRESKWIRDYGQNCINDANEIVAYCKKTFSNKNISSAEPAMENIKIPKWCDFSDKNCELNIEVRPFKCLEIDFQSDALTLPKDCLFGHLGGRGDCKIYKEWIVSAKKQCSLKPNWKIKSFGMLFQCGDFHEKLKPMFFKGIEFVCCPPHTSIESPKENIGDQVVIDHYLSHGVLETEKEEDKTYDDAVKEMKQSHSMLKNVVIKDYIKGEMNLKNLWNSNKKLAKYKEDILIKTFKTAYNSLTDQYTANQEQLLDFHDDRRKFLFITKLSASLSRLDEILQNPNGKEMEIISIMKEILDLLLIRKKEIIEEQNSDQLLGSHLISRLSTELKMIEHNVTDLFNKLNQVPQYKELIKQHLVEYLIDKYPETSFSKINNAIVKPKVGMTKLIEIISKYKFRSDDEKSRVHYDLGLDDKDQEDHQGNSEQKIVLDRAAMERQFGDKKLLFALVFGTLITAFVVLVVGSIVIMYRQRPSLFHYAKTKLQDQSPDKQVMQGFGIESSSVGKDMINGTPFNGYENPTYKIIQTAIDTAPAKVHGQCEPGNDNPSLPLIQS